jgi:hypothetical protein
MGSLLKLESCFDRAGDSPVVESSVPPHTDPLFDTFFLYLLLATQFNTWY